MPIDPVYKALIDYSVLGAVLVLVFLWLRQREKEHREDIRNFLSSHEKERKVWKDDMSNALAETRNVIKELSCLIQTIMFRSGKNG